MNASRPSARPAPLTLAAVCRFSLCVTLSAQQVVAGPLPTDPTIIHGQLRIETSGQTMNVGQSSQYGIINWNSFNVGAGHTVNFNNGSGATLNRVTGLDASSINGTLTATGSLFLINRNGVIIGTDGRVLTGGTFVASTLDILNADFLSGGRGFSLFGNSTQGVTNLGKITSTGGDVLLTGYTVSNKGTIEAAQGRVGLAAGTKVDVVTDAGWLNGAYAVSLGERGNDVTNEGRIQALAAELRTYNGNIYALAGNNTGLIQATGVTEKDGRVYLTATNGTVQSTGVITATRQNASGGTDGGVIEIEAASVENYGGTQDVSGATGGTIRIKTDSITTDTEMLARGTAGSGGTIAIEATREVLMTSAGRIDASGTTGGGSVTLASGPGVNVLSGQITATSSSGTGGTVALLGDRVSLLGASVDASGATGGGTVLVGGGYQGARVQNQSNASSTYISDRTILRADATGAAGDGGTVVAWADGTTQFAGAITARGGSTSGNGGSVETSGLGGLGVSGTVDASARAASGTNGQWLLDPKNITIGTVTDSLTEFRSTVEGTGGTPADQVVDGNFASSVDISGETAVLGGRANINNFFKGTIYIFESGKIAARIVGFNSTVKPQIEGDIMAAVDGGAYVVTSSSGQYVVFGAAYTFGKGTGWRSGTVNTTSDPLSAPVSGQTPNQKSRLVNPEGNPNFNGNLSSDSFGKTFQLVTQSGGGASLFIADPGFEFSSSALNVGTYYQASLNADGSTFGLFRRDAGIQANQRFGEALTASSEAVFVNSGSGTTASRDLFIQDLVTGQTQTLPNFMPADSQASANYMVANGLELFVKANSINYASFFRNSFNNGSITLSVPFTPLNLAFSDIRNFTASGDTLLLTSGRGSNFNGVVSFFQRPASGWGSNSSTPQNPVFTYNDTTTTSSGAASVAAIDGDYAIYGMPLLTSGGVANVGGAVQFRRSGGVWSNVGNLNAADSSVGSAYGASIAVEGITTVVGDGSFGDQTVGGNQNGRVYVYENGALAATLSAGNVFNMNGLGWGDRVAISGDRIAATGAGGVGSVFNRIGLFTKGSAWRNGTANLVSHYDDFPTLSTVNSLLETSLALDGNTLAFGRPIAEGAFSNATGRVAVFSNIASGLSNPVMLRRPGTALSTQDRFGASLALSGNTLAVGQSTKDFILNFEPNVFVYENLNNSWSGLTPTQLAASSFTDPNTPARGFFGSSLGLFNNTLAINATNSGVFVFERATTWSAATTPVAKLSVPNVFAFGYDVAVDGDKIAVTSGVNQGSNIAYLFDKQGQWRDGTANQIAAFAAPNPAGQANSVSGNLEFSGDTLLFAALRENQSGNSGARPVYSFTGPFDFSSRATFANNPGGTLNISAASLTASLSLGTDITLQANNDITVAQAITVNNPTGDGGNLSLFAGRNILVNAPIFTDNGDLTLVANDSRAIAAQRDSGKSAVVLGRDTSTASATLTLGTGNLVISAGDSFENRSGSSTPFVFDATTPGSYLVYAATPDHTTALDKTNLLADLATTGRNFVQFNTSFNLAAPRPAALPAGNGFVYTVQPTVALNVGNAAITYGQATNASLSLASVTVGGSTVSAETFGVTSADLANLVNFGLSNTVPVSAGGFANAGSYTGALTVAAKSTVTTGSLYGVAVSTGAAGNLDVAKKQLDVRPNDATKIYGNTNPAFSLAFTGFVSGDTSSVLDSAPVITTTALDRSNIGGYLLTATGGLDNNYTLNSTGTGLLTIIQRDLAITGLTGVNRVYDATTAAQFTGTATIAPLSGDAVTLGGGASATASFTTKDKGDNKALTFSGFSISGGSAGNYNLLSPTGVTANVTPASLVLGGLSVADKTYDRTTAAVLQGAATIAPLGKDSVSLDGIAVGNFANRNAGTNKAVTVTGLSISGAAAANYVLANPTGFVASILKRDLNVAGLGATDRVYNATTAVAITGAGLITPLSGDSVSLIGTAIGALDDKNVGVGKAVTVSGLSLDGTDKGNYTLKPPVNLVVEITKASLAVTGVSAVNRIYDATQDVALAGTATVAALAQDQVAVIGTAGATVADKNVGNAKPVTVTGYALDGTDAGNYEIVQPVGLAVAITPRSLVLTGLTPDNKVYDATTSATGVGTATVGGILSGDTVTIDDSAFSFAFANKNVGQAKPLVISGVTLSGTGAGNYDPTSAFGFNASITPATLSVTGATAANRNYNATRNVGVSGGSLQGVLLTDAITFETAQASGTVADKHVGDAKAVTVTGYAVSGNDAGNYVVEQPTGLTVNLAKAPVQLVNLNGDKTYDRTRATTLTHGGLDAAFVGDDVLVDGTAVAATYADKTAGSAKPITITGLFALSGQDKDSYTLSQPFNLVGEIARLGITVSGLTIADKDYDGTNIGQISGTGTFGGVIAGDKLQINTGVINVTFADQHAGVNKAVALSGVTLSGDDADNYTAATPVGITATIRRKDVQVQNLAALDKVYDRTTVATVNGTGTLVGIVGTEAITLNESARTGSFDDKNVGIAKDVTVNGLTLGGTGFTNYRLIAPVLSAEITPADVAVSGLSSAARDYDTTRNAVINGAPVLQFGSLANVLANLEDVQLVGSATGLFATKTVGTAKAITLGGISLTGNDATNYTLKLPTNLTATVNKADLAVTGAKISDRDYDATTVASVANAGSVQALSGDSVNLTGTLTANFTTKTVGLNKPVAINGYSLLGDDAGNYRLVTPTNLTASIAQAELALFGLIADTRAYDGTLAASLSGSLQISPFAGDNVSVAGAPSATFADKNVGTAKAVTLTGLSLSGGDKDNYRFVLPALSADIEKRLLTVSGISALGRDYDGSRVAGLTGTAVLNNKISGDDLGFDLAEISGSFTSKNKGTNKLVTLTGDGLTGGDAGNYEQALPFNLVATVAPKSIGITGVDAVDRVYDATRDVALTGGALAGVVSGDAVSLNPALAGGTVTTKTVGENKPVVAQGYQLDGLDAPNYVVTQPTGVDVTIRRRQVDILGVQVADKLFDGNTSATLSGGTLAGFVFGDAVNLVTTAAKASFATADVGTLKPVVLEGFTLSGTDEGNYLIDPNLKGVGRILPSLKEITDVIPAEVLRAQSASAVSQQQASLQAFVRAAGESAKRVDYTAFNDLASDGIATASPVNETIALPGRSDPLTLAYLAATKEAEAATKHAQDLAYGYRLNADNFKKIGAEANKTAGQLQLANATRATFVTLVGQVKAQLAQADTNLAAISEAKRTLSDYAVKMANAARLGRGSEVAEYQRIIDAAQAIVATEAETLRTRAALAIELTDSNAKLAESDEKIAGLTKQKAELDAELAATEARALSLKGELAGVKQKAAEASQKAAAATAVLAESVKNQKATAEKELSSLQALASSDVAAKTAAQMVTTDPFVKQFENKLVAAQQVTQTLGTGLASNLSPQALDYAKTLAAKINSGGLLDTGDEMRNALVQSVPALKTLQAQVVAIEQQQAAEQAAMEARIQQLSNLPFGAMPAAQVKAQFDRRLNELTGGVLDLSKVPTTNASGKVLSDLERLSIAILNSQMSTAASSAASAVGSAQAAEMEFAAGYQARLSKEFANEFGFAPEQVLTDPKVVAKNVVGRVPFNSDGSFDKEQLAENLKVGVSAYVNLEGQLKEQAIRQAAAQDPTGTLNVGVVAEKAARDEFVKAYGAQPEDLVIKRVQDRIDAYKNADSPEALMKLYATDSAPGLVMGLEAATKAYNDLKAGTSPDAVVKDMASDLWNGGGTGASANQEAAKAATTGVAMRDAAISAAEQADKTGLFKSYNTVTGAAGDEFAKTFGASPEQMGIKALEDPLAAANQVKNVAKDVFTTPSGALNVTKVGISTASNMADAALNTAKQQLDVVGAKFGDAGKAAAFVAKYGITAVSEVKNFAQDVASTLTGGAIPKSGPSKEQIEAGIAFAKAQAEVANAEAQKAQDTMLLQYFKAAQDLAKAKAQLAAGVMNAKAQVGGYIVAAKTQNDRQTTFEVAKQVMTTEITRVVQTGINQQLEATQDKRAGLGQ